jgi:hypothetical protein
MSNKSINYAKTQMIPNEKKIGWFEYLYFFMIVIYGGMAIGFTSQMMSYCKQPLGFLIPILMSFILLVRNKISFNNKSFLAIIGLYTLWVLLHLFIFSHFNLTYTIFIYYNIVIAFILISVYNTTIFLLYEKIITQLSIVAIIGWVFMITIPNILGKVIDIIRMPGIFDSNDILRGNIIIFSMTNSETYKSVEVLGLTRNSGFSWEPGRYATMVVVAIYLNLARTQFQIKGNNGFWILLIALLTTQSTTGFMAFSIIIFGFLINQKSTSKILYLFLIIPMFITAFNLPFLGEKITALMDFESTKIIVEDNIKYFEKIGETYVPQRFDGLQLELQNIINQPLLGYGNDVKDSYVNNNISDELSLSNGIFKVIARFGLILGLLFYFALFKSSIWISDYYRIKGGAIYFLVFLAISISYDFTTIPVFLSITLFPFFSSKVNYAN